MYVPGHARELSRDSEEYASVYENARLTLSATGSETMVDDLLLQRPVRALAQVLGTARGDATERVSVCALPLAKDTIREYYRDMVKQAIARGVWSFQA